jgi:hypothetical protein
MSVAPRMDRFKQVSHYNGLPGHGVSPHLQILAKEIDRKTFLEMWDLSRPGGDAEECFLRINQTELCDTRIPRPNPIETMPNVSSPENAQ